MSMAEMSQIEVTQEDRNAAGTMCLGGLIYEVREGQCDGLDIVQAFARHRIAAEQRGIKEGLERAAVIADRIGRPVGASEGSTYIVGTSSEAATAIRNAKDSL